ncbi:MAG TPA: DUF3179 domain-containing protein [Candidatus Limnocylindria bacterium]|jgi:hypothetical protein|nr:DUF3179 domain-containing protein [Candidatus Limnocylindria bacterium]
MKLGRRRLLLVSGAALAAACAPRVDLPGSAAAPSDSDELDEISRAIQSGGPPPDGIPPVDRPTYVSIAEASKQWRDDALMDTVTIDGQARAYPRFITVWHEIVNESADGRPIAITYCPLTGSTLVFSGQLADGRTTTFGTSGMLSNSNLVMYDRATKSMWPQLLGVAVRGDRKGERLAEIGGAVTTTFGRWKAKFPDGVVLSKETGHARAYGTWPYGDYDTSSTVMFPVRATDDRFHRKKIVVGIRVNGAALAIPKDEFAQRREASIDVGGRELVARYDVELDAVRVLDRRTLEAVSAYNVMWFAWYAFNPKTEVLR